MDVLPVGPLAGHGNLLPAHSGQERIHTALAAVRHREGDHLGLGPHPFDLLGQDIADFLGGHGTLEGIWSQDNLPHVPPPSLPARRASAKNASSGTAWNPSAVSSHVSRNPQDRASSAASGKALVNVRGL